MVRNVTDSASYNSKRPARESEGVAERGLEQKYQVIRTNISKIYMVLYIPIIKKKKSVCVYRGMLHTHFIFCFAAMLILFFSHLIYLFSHFIVAMLNSFFLCENNLAWTRFEPEPSKLSSFEDRPLNNCAELMTWQYSLHRPYSFFSWFKMQLTFDW